ncbi:MAG: GNAT family N-acetyltransferase [Spirulina sp. SIO3F2]|nr:GNAT family N-acetyltransferase [Spirulina sp. SIO3F2]
MLLVTCQVRWVNYLLAQTEIRQIRDRVFVQEQQIPLAHEFDGQDPYALHALAYHQDQAVGTLRLRILNANTIKLERLAVLSPFRGQGIGSSLTQAALSQTQRQGYQQIVLHAQQYIVPLYAKLGFQAQGEPFIEADIPHIKMGLTVAA